jgi:RNA polymerase sigma factor (TIGR02999 family)
LNDAKPPVTALLVDMQRGRDGALDELMPLVYAELRDLAARYLRRERDGGTLQPTALVHEAFLRLVDQRTATWQNRAHFLGVAAQVMRRIVVDHARRRKAQKRGGGRFVTFDEELAPEPDRVDLVRIDEALGELERLDARQARVVELRYFGGLTIEETGEVLGTSPATVKRDWLLAKAWLFRALSDG